MEPDTSSDQRRVIQASEILAMIVRGEDVEYDGVIVVGDLDISGLDLPTEHVVGAEHNIKFLGLAEEVKLIASSICITNSEIRGNVRFGNVIFMESAIFKGNNFRGNDVNFGVTYFNGIADFSDTKFKYTRFVNFKGAEFCDDAVFVGANFSGRANFEDVEFGEQAVFRDAELGKYAFFRDAKFSGTADFVNAKFVEYAEFDGMTIRPAGFNGHADFNDVEFGGMAAFRYARFDGHADFVNAKFGGLTDFKDVEFGGYADFESAEFVDNGAFGGAEFRKYLSFKETVFNRPESQEAACRIAKRKMEEIGNKREADDYFYREMEAIRIQKGIKGIYREIYQHPSNVKERLSQFRSKIAQMPSKTNRFVIYDVLEYIFIQRIFGYGVRPFNVAKAWLIVVFTLGFVYLVGSGVEKANNTLEWYEYFYFSIVTAATPGYASYTPASGLYTLIAGAEAIFGTFMWAAFIATFARKWQR